METVTILTTNEMLLGKDSDCGWKLKLKERNRRDGMKETTYFVRWRGEVSGPYDISVLKDMLETGKVTKHHQISADRQSWVPIMSVLVEVPTRSMTGKEEATFFKPTAPPSVEIVQSMPTNHSAETVEFPGSENLNPSPEPTSHGLRLAKDSMEPAPPSFPEMQQNFAQPAINIQHTFTAPLLRASGLSIASLVMGILGVLCGWMCCGLIFPILAIVFGHIAHAQINRQPTVLTGKGMAITGFILGYVSLVLSIIIGLAFGIFAAIMEQATKNL